MKMERAATANRFVIGMRCDDEDVHGRVEALNR
jgi:hypothetical protein